MPATKKLKPDLAETYQAAPKATVAVAASAVGERLWVSWGDESYRVDPDDWEEPLHDECFALFGMWPEQVYADIKVLARRPLSRLWWLARRAAGLDCNVHAAFDALKVAVFVSGEFRLTIGPPEPLPADVAEDVAEDVAG